MNRIIFGRFDGQNMTGDDGKTYLVRPNYASKSRLVVGDELKLCIEDDGNFVYKQLAPVTRRRMIGIVTKEYTVAADNKIYKVLPAMLTYFKTQPGDEAVILTPEFEETQWAALDNIIKK